jgi:hypothetical protein
VGTPPAVGVYDDFAAGETSVALGAADNEETGGLNLAILAMGRRVECNIRDRQSCHQASEQE